MIDQTLTPHTLFPASSLARSAQPIFVLVVLWSLEEPGRIGEILQVPPGSPGPWQLVGRGEARPDDPCTRLELFRQRPGRLESTGSLQAPAISRRQLQIRALSADRLEVENVGRCPMLHNGHRLERAELQPGDVLELQHQLLLLCAVRPAHLPAAPIDGQPSMHPFGEADAFGLVGESPAIWELRQQIAFTARQGPHVLILGSSGTGKELVAQAIHLLSRRGHRRLVSRNAATFPEGVMDAELFGNARNYPNAGMAERPGLIGEAHGSTLFLDEFGEMPTFLQAKLLRVMDLGEYQRLGESSTLRSDFRLLAATNRAPEALKHDVLARLKLHVQAPDLNHRREDIPLLVRHLLRHIAAEDPSIARRFFEDGLPTRVPRITPALMTALVRHPYATHVRELEKLLWPALAGSQEGYLDLVGSMVMEGSRDRVSSVAHASTVETRTAEARTAEARTAEARTAEARTAEARTAEARTAEARTAEARTAEARTAESPFPAQPEDSPTGEAPGPFSAEDRVLLTFFRRYRFSVTDCAADPDFPVERATANAYLLVFFFKALQHAGWDQEEAARWVAGPDSALAGKVQRRMLTALQNLKSRMAVEDPIVLRARLVRSYRTGFRWVEPVMEALRDGTLPLPP